MACARSTRTRRQRSGKSTSVSGGKLHILFAGGGTGGHLFPAIAIADEIRRVRPAAAITFVGTKKKIESRVVPGRGYAFETIWISGFRRKLTVENLLFPLKLVVALVQSFVLIRKLKPVVVVGTGGYVCGPVVYVASLLGIPTVIQEQNSFPGVTTRVLASRATEVHLAFESSAKFLSRKDNIKVSGNPVRSAFGNVSREEAARFLGLDHAKKTLLVFGGSLGAKSINDAMIRSYREIINKGVQVIWQTGDGDYERVCGGMAETKEMKVLRFIERMEFAYAACDLAVCRAGATTLAELTLAGVPSVLVPYPFAAADHQTENARVMVGSGASVLLADDEVSGKLFETITVLLGNEGRLSLMAEKARSLGKPGAASSVASAILALIKA